VLTAIYLGCSATVSVSGKSTLEFSLHIYARTCSWSGLWLPGIISGIGEFISTLKLLNLEDVI
jgi:hypothetical protein